MAQKPVFISAATTEAVLDWPSMIDGIRGAYAVAHQSHTSYRAVARGEGVWMRSLVSIPPRGRLMGAKLFGRTAARQVTYLLPLFDQSTSELVALVDGRHLTALRTAATSAVAVDRLTSDAPVCLGVLGSGGEARSHVEAIAQVRHIESLAVYSPTADRRVAFAAHFTDKLGIPCRAFDSPEPVVRASNLVVAAARSRDESPIIDGDWLASDALLVSIGSTIPEQRELDVRSIERADLIVCDMLHEVLDETGDFLAAKAAHIGLDGKMHTLNDLVMDRLNDRVRMSRLRIYKSVGAAIQDVTVAELAYRAALQQGRAIELDAELSVQHV